MFTETGGFDDHVAEYFLKTYWQKHPVLFRSAFKFESPVSPDELAGLVRQFADLARLLRSNDYCNNADRLASKKLNPAS